jgi:membrane protein involved in colicin uptake
MDSPGPSGAPTKRRVGKWLAIAGAVAVLLGLVGGGVAWKVSHDARVAAEEADAAARKAAAAERDKQEREQAAAAAAQDRRDEAARADRRASVSEIEASVKKMAEGHAGDGIIDGPIIDVTCSPVGGGSTDDLTEQTTVFECFAANKDNGDGTMSGYTYSATMNWSTGSFTYSLGAP